MISGLCTLAAFISWTAAGIDNGLRDLTLQEHTPQCGERPAFSLAAAKNKDCQNDCNDRPDDITGGATASRSICDNIILRCLICPFWLRCYHWRLRISRCSGSRWAESCERWQRGLRRSCGRMWSGHQWCHRRKRCPNHRRWCCRRHSRHGHCWWGRHGHRQFRTQWRRHGRRQL